MPDIRPFQIVHYSDKHAGELNKLITPPYDIISPAEQEAFYRVNELNVIRLVLGKQYADDSDDNNRYTRAGATLRKWLDEGALTRDERPGFAIYRMEFDQLGGGRGTIDGIIALVKVDDYGQGKVLPHEKTYKGPKVDQLNLLRACRAHFTPIHGLFHDYNEQVVNEYSKFIQGPPQQETVDANGTVHKVWVLYDEESIARIRKALESASIFIADGHHRYETSLAYKKEMIATGHDDPDGGHQHVMMYLTAMSHPGLTILPAHRMVKGLKDFELEKIEDALSPYFHIEELCFSEINRDDVSRKLVERIRSYSDVGGKFGMVVRGENCFKLLRLKDFSAVDSMMDSDIPSTLRGLDVTILREVIMNHGLGMDRENNEGLIEYTPLISEALNQVMEGKIQVSFILNPTRVDQMRAAAELGHKLPHKSTYFFPKLSSGLVINVF
ncbi:MAG: DUF1015 domain-containing protein [Desulfomonile tiedjei]|uniref:DUF1015 domain-containing protein n=1 Tax=Desulfomonile tiedjei TaxID=2358 RepID=A0A9D6Z4Q7_9BACT|nr:DUF1015 domain-containing protein [Desulfomonile tiedjei]